MVSPMAKIAAKDHRVREIGLSFLLDAAKHLRNDASDVDVRLALICTSTGVELLLKQPLIDIHWSLVFEKIQDADLTKYNEGNFVSVAPGSCQGRLQQICGIKLAKKDLDALDALTKSRNRLVHFGVMDEPSACKIQIVRALRVIIFSFLHNDDVPNELSTAEAELLTEIKSKIALVEDYVNVGWHKIALVVEGARRSGAEFFRCPACMQIALRYEIDVGLVECLFCQAKVDEDYRHRAISDNEVAPELNFQADHLVGCCSDMLLRVQRDENNPHSQIVYCFSCGKTGDESSFQGADLAMHYDEQAMNESGMTAKKR
jgi:hypothetical protein